MPLCSPVSIPMLNFFDRPLAEFPLCFLQSHGINRVTVITREELRDFTNYLNTNLDSTMEITCKTMGNIPDAITLQEEEDCVLFFQIPVTDIDLQKAIFFHENQENPVTLVISDQHKNTLGARSEITIAELQSLKKTKMLCALLRPAITITVNQGNLPTFPLELPLDTKISLHYADGYFATVSSIKDYSGILKECLDHPKLLTSYQNGNGVFLNENTFLEVGAKIKPPVYIGKNVSILKNAEILPYSIICKNSKIGENVKIADSVLLENCKIADNTVISGSFLGNDCQIEENTFLPNGSVLGTGSHVFPATSPLFPSKIQKRKSQHNFSFCQNPFPLPEENPHIFLQRLGEISHRIFDNGILGLFYDDSPLAEYYQHSLHIGIKSAGISIYEFPPCTLSMAKSACPFYHLQAGFYLFSVQEKLWITILDENGCFISREQEQAIEAALHETVEDSFPKKLLKTTTVNPYQLFYYSETMRRLGAKEAPCYLSVTTDSSLLSEYIRKMATCHKITVLTEKKEGILHFQSNGSGTDFTISDETGRPLTNHQIDAVIAALLIEEKEHDYISTIFTPEVILQMLKNSHTNIVETNAHPHTLDVALLKTPLQYFLKYDPVFLIIKILLYLTSQNKTLSHWISTLPKSFFIEKTLSTREQLSDALTRLLKIANTTENRQQPNYKIKSKKGVTIFSREKDSLKIISESDREEYAKELTDFYAAQCKES